MRLGASCHAVELAYIGSKSQGERRPSNPRNSLNRQQVGESQTQGTILLYTYTIERRKGPIHTEAQKAFNRTHSYRPNASERVLVAGPKSIQPPPERADLANNFTIVYRPSLRTLGCWAPRVDIIKTIFCLSADAVGRSSSSQQQDVHGSRYRRRFSTAYQYL